jgi:hypothetical protein
MFVGGHFENSHLVGGTFMNRLLRAVFVTAAVGLLPLHSASAQTAAYRGSGDTGGFLNIVGPGQDGVLNGPETIQAQAGTWPPHVLDQLSMYGDLVYNAPGLTEDRIFEFFKDASFGVKPTTSSAATRRWPA